MGTQPDDDRWREGYALIGKRLRWARELVYPTQAEFARALDVDKSTINKIENGNRTLSITTLIYAANKLRTGADFLLFGELQGVEPELRRRLLKAHPELYDTPPMPDRSRQSTVDPIWTSPPTRYRLDSDSDTATGTSILSDTRRASRNAR